MLYDFERLYWYRRPRRFRSAELLLVVIPKEIDIPSLIQYWQDIGRRQYGGDFIKYLEEFGGRRGVPDEDLPVIDLEAEVSRASWRWLERGVDTSKIGTKPYVPLEEEIRENEKRLKAKLEKEPHEPL